MKLNKLIELPYEQFVKELKDEIAKKKILSIINSGKLDGLPDDEKIIFSKGYNSPSNLIPTQKQLIIEKSVKWAIENKNLKTKKDLLEGKPVFIDDKEILTLNNKYVIDGHHRWVEGYCLNPNGKVKIYDIKLNEEPIEVLKIIQLAIASKNKDIPFSKSDGTNIFSMSENKIKKYIEDNISKEIKELFGIENVLKNILLLKQNNKHIKNAPDRFYMPQAGKADGFDKKLKKGEINFKKPFDIKELKSHNSFSEFLFEKKIGVLKDDIQIKIDLDTSKHAEERKLRHGDENPITDEEIINSAKKALDEIGERQLKGIDKVGKPYWIYDKQNNHLNIIAYFLRNKTELILRIATVMREKDFRNKANTFKITV